MRRTILSGDGIPGVPVVSTGSTNVTDGLVVVDKPAGLTSQAVVSRCKRALGVRKAGHAGTLDPMATGVLVVGVGKATRLLGYLAGHDKTYVATIRLGQATTTDDAEGEPLGEPVDATGLTDQAIGDAMAAYVGDIEQVPSAVSAIKVDGQRAYARVRAGEAVELAPRPVTVSRYDVESRTTAGPFCDLVVAVDCSSGTYIRALARDLGRDLGVGGHLTALRRLRVGAFDAARAVPLEEVTPDAVLGLAHVARASFPVVEVSGPLAADVSHGRALALELSADPTALLGPDGALLGLYAPDRSRAGWARALAVLV